MRAPRYGLLAAVGVSVLLSLALALASGAGWETLTTDLRHRWVAASAPPTAGASPTAGAPRPTAHAQARPALGMNVFLEQEVEPTKRRRSLELLRDAGVRWIRFQVPWEQIEPVQKGRYVDRVVGVDTWAKFDDIVASAEQMGFRMIVRLDTSPPWALPPAAPDGLGPPLRYEDYWDFVAAVASRYRGRVAAYQVWNEPNLHIEWGRQPPDASAYARLLRGAAERIRRADPQARVVLAALAPTLTENQQAQPELTYLQALYDAGARDAFDVVAVQAYGLRGGPDDPRVGDDDVTFSRPSLVRALMVRNGDAAKPLWATEMGWNASPPPVGESQYGRVPPVLQARYTVRGLERMAQEWPWLELAAVWFWKRANDFERDQDWYWFGLADAEFGLRPAYYALRDFSATRGQSPGQ